jgi:hypothetical protein
MAMLKPDRLNIRIFSIMVGQTLHIGCCATGLSATGRWRVDHLQAPDQGRARSWRGRRHVERLTGIRASRRGRTPSVKSSPFIVVGAGCGARAEGATGR